MNSATVASTGWTHRRQDCDGYITPEIFGVSTPTILPEISYHIAHHHAELELLLLLRLGALVQSAQQTMLRELALLALVVAPACLTEAFTVATPPHAARGTYAARSRHPPLASIGKWRGHAYDTCTTDDESSTSTRSDLLGAGANSLAAAAVAAAAAIVAVGSPLEAAAAAAAEREPEITSKGFIEVRRLVGTVGWKQGLRYS